jgi:hypothetical protein
VLNYAGLAHFQHAHATPGKAATRAQAHQWMSLPKVSRISNLAKKFANG